MFPLGMGSSQPYFRRGCGLAASPQATFELPLAKVDALVDIIKTSERKIGAGLALSGPRRMPYRQGVRSQALYDAQSQVNRSRDRHIRAMTPLSDGGAVTRRNYSAALQGLLILLVSYLRTSEITYDLPGAHRDYEKFAKAYLPLSVKNPFRLLFDDLIADEKRVFVDLYGEVSRRPDLWQLAKDPGVSASAADGGKPLFPDRVQNHQKRWFQTPPTWDDLIDRTIANTPLTREVDQPKKKKGEDVGCEVLFAPLSRILPYETGSRRVAVELRRLGHRWWWSHGDERSGRQRAGWLRMARHIFDTAQSLNG